MPYHMAPIRGTCVPLRMQPVAMPPMPKTAHLPCSWGGADQQVQRPLLFIFWLARCIVAPPGHNDCARAVLNGLGGLQQVRACVGGRIVDRHLPLHRLLHRLGERGRLVLQVRMCVWCMGTGMGMKGGRGRKGCIPGSSDQGLPLPNHLQQPSLPRAAGPPRARAGAPLARAPTGCWETRALVLQEPEQELGLFRGWAHEAAQGYTLKAHCRA